MNMLRPIAGGLYDPNEEGGTVIPLLDDLFYLIDADSHVPGRGGVCSIGCPRADVLIVSIPDPEAL